ncbi:MAG: alpha/beta hydrolase [Dehalococcoidia bacterium]|nr:alpha/beta hydrolase [Dehalococcoidia bacterium]
MPVELVTFVTADQVRLPGALYPAATTSVGAVDAILLNPGTSDNFWGPILTPLATLLAEAGYPCLAISSRGHDYVWRNALNGKLYGAAYERVSECRYDFDAAFDVLRARGYRRLALLGHSLGGTKALYYAAYHAPADLCAVIACSPPRWSAANYRASDRAEAYERTRALAERMVAEGRGDELFEIEMPIARLLMQASGWLEKYGGENYNMATYYDQIRVPTLHLVGALEQYDASMRNVGEDLMRLADNSPYRQTVVIPDGDHFYSRTMPQVAAAIVTWLRGLPLAPTTLS